MGYYTRHSLTVELKAFSDPTKCALCGMDCLDDSYCRACGTLVGGGIKRIIQDLRDTNEDANYSLDENGNCAESSKWYDCDEDLITFSKKYPTVIFTLYGEGEEPGDIWYHYFKDGECQLDQVRMEFEGCKL